MSLKSVRIARITGNTYACRDAIKRLGGRWDGERKCWIIDVANHRDNTMRGRSGLNLKIRDLERTGCKVEYD